MKRFLLVAVAAVALSGCLKNKDEDRRCEYDECSLVAPVSEVQGVENYLAQNNITNAQKHCSGVYYAIDSMGTGLAPKACSRVSFRYKGMFTNGTVFDQSETPIGPIPLSNLVRGWVNVLPKIKQGGGMRIYLPPTLGYGTTDYIRNGVVIIPANSILIFEVKLDGVN